MSTHNLCFHQEIRKYQDIIVEKITLSRTVIYLCPPTRGVWGTYS